MKKVALIDENAGTGYIFGLVYFPDDGKSLPFKEFYEEVSAIRKKYPGYVTLTKPVICDDLGCPIKTEDYFSAEIYLSMKTADKINPDEKPFSQMFQDLGYRTIAVCAHDGISIEEIRNRLKESDLHG